MKVNDSELVSIIGGGLTASVLNYLATALKTVYAIGQGFGGAMRRIAKNNLCPM